MGVSKNYSRTSKHKRHRGGGWFSFGKDKLKVTGLKSGIGNVESKMKGDIVKFTEKLGKGKSTSFKVNLSESQKTALNTLKSAGNKVGHRKQLLNIQKAAKTKLLNSVTHKSPLQGTLGTMGTITGVKNKMGKKINTIKLAYNNVGKQTKQVQKTFTNSFFGKKPIQQITQKFNNTGRIRKIVDMDKFGKKSLTKIIRNDADPNKIKRMVTSKGLFSRNRYTDFAHGNNGSVAVDTYKKFLGKKLGTTLHRNSYSSISQMPTTALGTKSGALKNTLTARKLVDIEPKMIPQVPKAHTRVHKPGNNALVTVTNPLYNKKSTHLYDFGNEIAQKEQKAVVTGAIDNTTVQDAVSPVTFQSAATETKNTIAKTKINNKLNNHYLNVSPPTNTQYLNILTG